MKKWHAMEESQRTLIYYWLQDNIVEQQKQAKANLTSNNRKARMHLWALEAYKAALDALKDCEKFDPDVVLRRPASSEGAKTPIEPLPSPQQSMPLLPIE